MTATATNLYPPFYSPCQQESSLLYQNISLLVYPPATQNLKTVWWFYMTIFLRPFFIVNFDCKLKKRCLQFLEMFLDKIRRRQFFSAWVDLISQSLNLDFGKKIVRLCLEIKKTHELFVGLHFIIKLIDTM